MSQRKESRHGSSDMSSGDEPGRAVSGGFLKLSMTSSSGGRPPSVCEGYLEKKSGGKKDKQKAKVLERWTRRYFVLPEEDARLWYYRDLAAFQKDAAPLGVIDCRGATFFLKEEIHRKDSIYRFTLCAASRELKLRTRTVGDYEAWTSALKVSNSANDTAQPFFFSCLIRLQVAGAARESDSLQPSALGALTLGNAFDDADDNEEVCRAVSRLPWRRHLTSAVPFRRRAATARRRRSAPSPSPTRPCRSSARPAPALPPVQARRAQRRTSQPLHSRAVRRCSRRWARPHAGQTRAWVHHRDT